MGVDGPPERAILLTRPTRDSFNQEFVLRTFGTANCTQFCPGNDLRKRDSESATRLSFFVALNVRE